MYILNQNQIDLISAGAIDEIYQLELISRRAWVGGILGASAATMVVMAAGLPVLPAIAVFSSTTLGVGLGLYSGYSDKIEESR